MDLAAIWLCFWRGAGGGVHKLSWPVGGEEYWECAGARGVDRRGWAVEPVPSWQPQHTQHAPREHDRGRHWGLKSFVGKKWSETLRMMRERGVGLLILALGELATLENGTDRVHYWSCGQLQGILWMHCKKADKMSSTWSQPSSSRRQRDLTWACQICWAK